MNKRGARLHLLTSEPDEGVDVGHYRQIFISFAELSITDGHHGSNVAWLWYLLPGYELTSQRLLWINVKDAIKLATWLAYVS